MLLVGSMSVEEFDDLAHLAFQRLGKQHVFNCIGVAASARRTEVESHDARQFVAEFLKNLDAHGAGDVKLREHRFVETRHGRFAYMWARDVRSK